MVAGQVCRVQGGGPGATRNGGRLPRSRLNAFRASLGSVSGIPRVGIGGRMDQPDYQGQIQSGDFGPDSGHVSA